MRRLFLASVVCILALLAGCGAPRSEKEPSCGTIAPLTDKHASLVSFKSSEITGWKLESPIKTYDKKTIFDYIDGAAELYFAYDFIAVASAEYRDGESSIIVDVYDMTTPENAFGIYSINRYPEAEYVDIGNEGMLSGTALDFWKGKYFCKIYSFSMSDKYKKAVVNFGNVLALKIDEAGEEPAVIKRLPQSGLMSRTAKFFHTKLGLDNIHYVSEENVLNLSLETKGVIAEYEINGSGFRLFVIEYASSEKSSLAFDSYSKYLGGKGKLVSAEGTDQGKSGLFKTDGKFASVKLTGNILSGFWDVETQDTAELALQNLK